MGLKAGKVYPSSEGKVGVLITNLGTPEAPTAKALRHYLSEFLSDPRVVEIPRLIWMFILHGIILRVRPKKSAHAYQTVWAERGSPLKYHTEDQLT
ncbi:ferrochelatase, partial [Oleiphilus sp. HI0128]